MIAPNSYVPAGSRIPAHTLWAGTPAKYISEVQEGERTIKDHSKDQIRLMEE